MFGALCAAGGTAGDAPFPVPINHFSVEPDVIICCDQPDGITLPASRFSKKGTRLRLDTVSTHSFVEAKPSTSVTATEKTVMPPVTGVPLSSPSAVNVTPSGKVPATILHV